MKTNYILLILLLSFSFASAQDNVEAKKIESTVMVSQNNEEVSLNANDSETVSTIKEDVTTEATLVRSNSDIRIYLNRLRNVENIDLLFPKINKTVKV
ncbi:hypothetical protein [Confluentibacter flavum]|uniref:TonB-dependent receptor n=1 Tax=Confluentibacter flavum TaxID=1909700 RepID=A0A2N3HH62_9FLAO|nr:hypothetical protein [Confluentibacter flavum]PKQ44301.1 hypothetical protein CSW08_14480 [Confluentibacter flavum]